MKNRRAVSLIELSAATVLVAALLALGLQTLGSMKRHQRESERRSVATQLVVNLMEQATTMDLATLQDMTDQQRQAAGLWLSPEHLETLPGAELVIEVEPVATADDTPASRRVAITLSWRTQQGQPAAPLRLVAWGADRKEAP